jgi:hypothetical protein
MNRARYDIKGRLVGPRHARSERTFDSPSHARLVRVHLEFVDLTAMRMNMPASVVAGENSRNDWWDNTMRLRSNLTNDPSTE